MRNIAIVLLGVSAFATTHLAQAEQVLPPAAIYAGDLQLPDGESMPLIVEFFKNAAGMADANVSSPAQGARYIAVDRLDYRDGVITLHTVSPDAVITGNLNANGVWEARFEQGAFAAPVQLEPGTHQGEELSAQSQRAMADTSGQEVSIPTQGAVLAGTLTVPSDPKAAILLLSGSGAAQRDGYHRGHRPLAVLAAELNEMGVASLRFDKRGVYKSTGELDIADLETLELDALAALQMLKTTFTAVPIGIVGHSEGGVLAARLAQQDEQVAFVVSLMGPTLPLAELFALQDGTEALAEGATQAQAQALTNLTSQIYATAMEHDQAASRLDAIGSVLERASEAQREAFEAFNGGTGTLGPTMLSSPHYDELLAVNPMVHWQQTDVPGLLVFGGMDAQVPAQENTARIDQQPNLTVVTLPNVNHLLQPASTAAPSAYARISQTVAASVIDLIKEWLAQQITAPDDATSSPEKPALVATEG